jgi:carboxymethylenebutenolidase
MKTRKTMKKPLLAAAIILTLAAAALAPTGATAAAKAADHTAAESALASTDQVAQMAAEHQHDMPTASPAATTEPAQPVTASEVMFGQNYGRPLRGYLASPKTPPGPVPGQPATGHPVTPQLPGLIVIHEWWGLNDNIKAVTRRLAGEGYTALAVDLYDGKVADNPDGAKKLMAAVISNPDYAKAVLQAADEFLKKQGAPRIGVIGWCFGGGWSLATALNLPQGIDAAVMYYGQPEKDRTRLAQLRAPLLGLFGADDHSIPPAAVHEMEATLKQLGKSVEVHIYDGAGHAFANPSGTGYRPAAADDAWQRTTAFLSHNLRGM